jgi:putative copper resistance protein D
MNELLASARAVHFAATMWLFGELVLACALAGWRAIAPPSGPGEALRRRLPAVTRSSIGIGIASAVAWLAAIAATMSGMPLSRAIAPSTLGAVLGGTLFGKVWILRCGLAFALLLLPWPRSGGCSDWRLVLRTVVAGVYLATLAWMGHAAAASGAWRSAQLVSDVVHLLAAGAWLGALSALVYLLATQAIDDAAWATRRFSGVAIASVSALIASGVGNSWFLVGTLPALLGTAYGRLLLAKLALLAFMLALAGINRSVLTPRLAGDNGHALRALRRNAMLEIAAGLGVVAIVGVLGITIPAAHQSPAWPFAHTLSWMAAQGSAATRWLLAACALVAAASLCVVALAARRRAWPSVAAGMVGIAAAAVASGSLLAVAAYPTTYAVSPVRYTTTAIVEGARLFATRCAACHGSDGAGRGPGAAGLSSRPINLLEHAGYHRPGELYWWIAHGRAGTPMPAFSPALASDDIWNVVQFLHALSDVGTLTDSDGQSLNPPPAAPDFSFELAESGQRTLLPPGEPRATLLVLYELPGSLARLRALVSARRAFAEQGIRVVAVAVDADDARAARAEVPEGESILAIAGPDVAITYAMFAGDHGASGAPSHAEFLIDGRGRLRARWLGVPDPDIDRNREVLAAAAMLDREPARASSPHEHMH